MNFVIAPRPEAPLVRVSAVEDVAATSQSFTRIVAARVQSDLGFRVAGKLSERLVDTWQTVKRGQPLIAAGICHLLTADAMATCASSSKNFRAADFVQQRQAGAAQVMDGERFQRQSQNLSPRFTAGLQSLRDNLNKLKLPESAPLIFAACSTSCVTRFKVAMGYAPLGIVTRRKDKP